MRTIKYINQQNGSSFSMLDFLCTHFEHIICAWNIAEAKSEAVSLSKPVNALIFLLFKSYRNVFNNSAFPVPCNVIK